MTAMIQIRNVPDALHRQLKSRAALAGMSLSDYLLSEIRQVAQRPTLDELRARLERRPGMTPSVAPAPGGPPGRHPPASSAPPPPPSGGCAAPPPPPAGARGPFTSRGRRRHPT